MFYIVEPEYPRTSRIVAQAAHQGGPVLLYCLTRPENYPKIGNWSILYCLDGVFVVGIFMRWEGREPFHIQSAASLLCLNFAKVSSTKDFRSRQTWQGILCLSAVTSHYSHNSVPKYKDSLYRIFIFKISLNFGREWY